MPYKHPTNNGGQWPRFLHTTIVAHGRHSRLNGGWWRRLAETGARARCRPLLVDALRLSTLQMTNKHPTNNGGQWPRFLHTTIVAHGRLTVERRLVGATGPKPALVLDAPPAGGCAALIHPTPPLVNAYSRSISAMAAGSALPQSAGYQPLATARRNDDQRHCAGCAASPCFTGLKWM